VINRDHDLPLTRQAQILGLSRSSLYYAAVPISDADLKVMRRIDHLHTDYPFMGARMLRDRLKPLGFSVARRHVARLMRLMGVEALYRKKKTTKRNPEHPVFPYLLRGLTIDRPNQVWAADISYIPMRRGFLYVFAIIDWATRRVLAWRRPTSASKQCKRLSPNTASRKSSTPIKARNLRTLTSSTSFATSTRLR
jgi:putative transposase